MKIVITAGGTTEQIDTVRSITNTSTGMLGSLIAEEFSSYQEVDRIYYICSKKSILPKTPKAAIHFVDTVASLESCVSNIVNNEKIDIIVQSMAVSDYRVKWVTSACQLAENINSTPNPLASFQATKDTKVTESQVTSWISNSNTVITGSGKINSGIHDMVLLMEPTPKIISIYKKLTPDSILVGFKLLDHVDHDTLIDTGYHLSLIHI